MKGRRHRTTRHRAEAMMGVQRAEAASGGTGRGGRCRQRATTSGGSRQRVATSAVDDGRHEMVRSEFEMGDDRKRMKVESSAMKETSLPRVATVINVSLRPQRIWDGLDVVVMIDDLDGFTEVRRRWVRHEEDDGVVLTVGTAMGGHCRMSHGGGRQARRQHHFAGVRSSNQTPPWRSPAAAMAAAFNVDGGAPYLCSMGVPHLVHMRVLFLHF
ncbi:hypothetical protein ACLOJK_026790 [Asimina triloba]